MNGLDLAEEIQEDSGGRVPVVLLSARASDQDISRGYRHGARYYITKPCEPRTVLDVVDYFIGDLEPEEREALERRL
jgi:DNA-binding response OmpR family regulator